MRTEKGKRIEAAFREAIKAAKGEVPLKTQTIKVPEIDVKSIRKRLGSTQVDFAKQFGFSLATVQNWEQGRRRPEKSARILLAVIDRAPETVCAVLEEASISSSPT